MTSRAVALGLTLALTLAAPAAAKDNPTSGLRYPCLTPDGSQVVFSYRGDLWIAPTSGEGPITRLTIHEAQDTLPRVSPDGKTIAFSSLRNGRYDLFTMSIDGGIPQQITFHSGSEILCDWAPDGEHLLFCSERDADDGRLDLYEVHISGTTPRRITTDGARDASYSPDGKTIVYARGFNSIYWDNYEGSANYDLYTIPRAGGTPTQLTSTAGNENHPFFSADAATIYFTAEKDGTANLFSIPAAGGDVTQVTKLDGADIHRPRPRDDRAAIVYERIGRLYITELAKPEAEPQALEIAVKSDVRSSGLETRTLTGGGEQVHVSPDGTSVAFTLRGDIWIMPANGGTGRRLTDSPESEQWPRFAPDGEHLAFFSAKTGNNDLYVMNLRSGKTEQITRHSANDHFHSWSPDSKRLAFCSERSGNKDIWLIDIETRETTQLTRHGAADDDPCFSPDGQHIAFDSGRDGAQAIYVMRADGSEQRRVSSGGGFLQVPGWSPDGKMLVFESYSPTNGQSDGIFVMATSGGPSMQISRDGSTACWAPVGDNIYFTADRGPRGNGIFRVRAPESVEAGEHVPFIGTVTVDLRGELAQLFDECWKALGEGFYDKDMHGVDWPAMRLKYRDMAIDSETKDEFHNVIRQMLAELGASHLGIWGGERAGNSVTPRVDETGYLGIAFENEPAEGGLKISEILERGPADRIGLRVGDVITRIGNDRLNPKTNLDKALAGTVGQKLLLTFKPFHESGLGEARRATIEPISFGQVRSLKYSNWVRTCNRTVHEATKKPGRYAYIHLNAMNQENLNRFRQAVAKWNSSDRVQGLVLDVRNNGGGNIHNQLMEILIAKPLAKVRTRNGQEAVQPALYWDRPLVVLINERSFSDAEVFPYMVKTAGVGTLVGVPTAGGVIGTNNITLSDGSSFRIPRTGFWGMDGTNLEGLGVKPDILVEETPEDRAANRDPQLAKAIEVLAKAISGDTTEPEATEEEGEEPEDTPDSAAPTKTPSKPTPKVYEADERDERAAPKEPPMHPLYDAAVGEWIKWRETRNGRELHRLLTVASISDDTVVLNQSVILAGEQRTLDPITRPRKETLTPPEGFTAKAYEATSLTVNGKALSVTCLTATNSGGQTCRWFVTNDVAVNGLVRFEVDGAVQLEVVEWGTSQVE